MGFFQSLKDDLSSAMNELINDDNLDNYGAEEDIKLESDIDPEVMLDGYTDSAEEYNDEETFDPAVMDLINSIPAEDAPFDEPLVYQDSINADELVSDDEDEAEEPRSARNAINSLRDSGKRLERMQLEEAIENGAVGNIIPDADEVVEEAAEPEDVVASVGAVDIMDVDVAAMLDKLDLDALAQSAGDDEFDADLSGQMNIEDLLKEIEGASEEVNDDTIDSAIGNALSDFTEEAIDLSAMEAVSETIQEDAVSDAIAEEISVDEIQAEELINVTMEEDIPAEEEPVIVNAVVEEAMHEETVIEEAVSENPMPEPSIEEQVINQTITEELKSETVAVTEAEGLNLMPKVPSYIPEVSTEFSDETAVITKGMRVVGNVASNGNMDVLGTIVGDINIIGKLSVTGTIVGKSTAHEIFADGAEINGDINVTGTVKVGQSSVIIGNISSTSAVIAGAVKGDIDVQGPVVLDSSAIVMGNIKSMSVQINNGAVIEGLCSQCYAQVSPTSFFNDLKKTATLKK